MPPVLRLTLQASKQTNKQKTMAGKALHWPRDGEARLGGQQ